MTDSYVLIYEERSLRPLYLGAWKARGKNLIGEALGLSILQGLGGFTKEATPRDLIEQLEQNDIRRATFPSCSSPEEEQALLLCEADDLARVLFKDTGQIEVRWLTSDSDLERALHDHALRSSVEAVEKAHN